VDNKSKLDDLTVKPEFNEAANGNDPPDDKHLKLEYRPPEPPGPGGPSPSPGGTHVSPPLRDAPEPETPRQILLKQAFEQAAGKPHGQDHDLGR